MRRIVIMFSMLAFSTLFMSFNPKGQIGFPFTEMVLTAETYFYFLFEHLGVLLLAVVILDLEHEYKIAAIAFVCIQVVDTVDYCLTYGEPWFDPVTINVFGKLFQVQITWNHIKIFVFGMVMLMSINKHLTKTWNTR